MEGGCPRWHLNAHPPGHSYSSSLANGYRWGLDHVAFIHPWPPHRDVGTYAHPICSSKQNAFIYSDAHRYSDGHSNPYHNVDAELNPYCYVNSNTNAHVDGYSRSTILDAGAAHGNLDTCSAEPYADAHGFHYLDGYRNVNGNPY